MKIVKTVSKNIEFEEVDKITCDICNEEIDNKGFDESEIEIRAKIGDVYPEVDCRVGYIIDCCNYCFLNKIRPLIEKTFGTKFRRISNNEFEKENIY